MMMIESCTHLRPSLTSFYHFASLTNESQPILSNDEKTPTPTRTANTAE